MQIWLISRSTLVQIRASFSHYQDKAQLGELIRHLKQIDHSLSIGIVINDHEESDRNLQKLAAAQQIDGVLPLNLRLDVFLAAIDLLIKGGEHFPSALLQHLRVRPRIHNRLAIRLTSVIMDAA